jgi:hypothetical protein
MSRGESSVTGAAIMLVLTNNDTTATIYFMAGLSDSLNSRFQLFWSNLYCIFTFNTKYSRKEVTILLASKLEEVVYVASSGIHGMGLFARKTINKGEILGEIKRVIAQDHDGPHVLWVDEITPIQVEGILKYINHSSNPNVAYYDDLTVVALRKINKGDELTHNYGESWVPE